MKQAVFFLLLFTSIISFCSGQDQYLHDRLIVEFVPTDEIINDYDTVFITKYILDVSDIDSLSLIYAWVGL